MNAGAMGIEPSVIAKLQGAGERGCKVMLCGPKHIFELVVRMFAWLPNHSGLESLSRICNPFQCQNAGLGGTGGKVQLGALCRNRWSAHRHENLWRVCAASEAH
jgi:hypothetical protein